MRNLNYYFRINGERNSRTYVQYVDKTKLFAERNKYDFKL